MSKAGIYMESIRYAVKEDIPFIMSLMDEASTTSAQADWYVTDDEDFVTRHIDREGYTLIYADNEDEAGFLIVRHPIEAGDNLGQYLEHVKPQDVAHMESAAVRPNHRGKGIQGKLLLAAERIEKSRGTKYLMATVHPDNCYSLGNLERSGYRCVVETNKYGGLRRKVMCKEIGARE